MHKGRREEGIGKEGERERERSVDVTEEENEIFDGPFCFALQTGFSLPQDDW